MIGYVRTVAHRAQAAPWKMGRRWGAQSSTRVSRHRPRKRSRSGSGKRWVVATSSLPASSSTRWPAAGCASRGRRERGGPASAYRQATLARAALRSGGTARGGPSENAGDDEPRGPRESQLHGGQNADERPQACCDLTVGARARRRGPVSLRKSTAPSNDAVEGARGDGGMRTDQRPPPRARFLPSGPPAAASTGSTNSWKSVPTVMASRESFRSRPPATSARSLCRLPA